jgi:hypothetical protein
MDPVQPATIMSEPTSNSPDAAYLQNAWFGPRRFALFLMLVLIATFPKVALGLETFFYRDFGVLAYPAIYHHHASFWRGELPLWNPLSNCGAPFLAQWGTMVLYPFSLFYLLLPLPWSVNFFCLIHLFGAGLGMYFLARRWTANDFAASIAGTGFVLNGITFSCLLWPNYTVALGWMPWVVLCAERAWKNGGRHLAVGAVVATLQMLSGVPEIALLTWLVVGAFVAMRLFQGEPEPLTKLARIAAIAFLTAGLMAAQLLPFLELLSHSHRTLGVNVSKWSLPIWGWANQFVPLFRCFLTPQGIFFQHGQEFMSSTYIGIGIVALGLFALARVRRAEVWILSALVLFALWMAMGPQAGFYEVMRQTVPLFGIMRYPVKFMVIVAFAAPLLAAYAIDSLAQRTSSAADAQWRWLIAIWLFLLALIAGIGWFAHQHPMPLDQWSATWQSGLSRASFLTPELGLLAAIRQWPRSVWNVPLKAGVFAVLLIDALTHVPNQNPTLPCSALAPGLWTLSAKSPAPVAGESRVMISAHAEQHLLVSRVASLSHDFLGKRLALWSHLNLLEQIPKVGGSSTLQIREQMEVQSRLYASTNNEPSQLIDFLGVSTITAPGQIVEWTQRSTHLPLATAGQRPIFSDSSNTLSAVMQSSFDPKQTVYLPLDAERFVTATNHTNARVVSKRSTSHRIELEAEADQPSLVVIAQSFYPAWTVSVDGLATRLWRANHAFQALEIPAGRHQIVLKYEDWKFRWGAIISGITFLFCAALWLSGKADTRFP